MDQFARERSYDEFRKTGVHRFEVDVPEKTAELKLKAYFSVGFIYIFQM